MKSRLRIVLITQFSGKLLFLFPFLLFCFKSSAQIGGLPLITVPPLDITVPIGGTATFTVVAVSGTTLSYQWQRDNVDISGATNVLCTIPHVGTQNGGRYRVRVSNAAGSVYSSAAALNVPDPSSRFTAMTVRTNGLQLQLTGTPGVTYVISYTTNMTTWTPLLTNYFTSKDFVFTDTNVRKFDPARPTFRFYRAEAR